MKKNVVVFGVGAIGSSIAAYLVREGCEITGIDPWFDHVVAIQKRGLHVTDPDGEFTVKLRALHVDQVKELDAPIDILILAVKSQDTEWSTRYLAPYLSSDGFIVSAQNSLNEEIISSIVGPGKTIAMVVTVGAGVYEPGELIRNTAMGDRLAFELGELDGKDTPRLRELTDLMSNAGITQTIDNIWNALWSKMGINCMANSLSGLTGFSFNPLFNNATARSVMMRLGEELVTVAEAHGISPDNIWGIPPENFRKLDKGGARVIEEGFLKAAAIRTGIRDIKASLLQDILKGRRTEVDYLNGLVVRKGKEKGIPTPLNQAVVEAVHRLEEGEIKLDPSNLELFKQFM